MAAPLAIDKEQIRMLYLELGAAETSRQTGIPDGTIRQWAKRGNWQSAFKPEKPLPLSVRPQTVTGVTNPADALANVLSRDERSTRIGLSRMVRRSVKLVKDVPVTDAQDALALGKLASLLYKWQADEGKAQVVVNLGFFSGDVG